MSWSLVFRLNQYVKGSLWLPSLLGVLVAALAGGLDDRLERIVTLPSGWTYSASTASTLLATIAGALVALTGFVLTVSVLVVQMATNTFSPRYMRLFYRDGMQKAVLAVLVGTLTFDLGLLRRTTTKTVPDLGVTATAALVVISMLLFVIFLNRFLHRLRPVAVAALVARAGKRALASTLSPNSGTRQNGPGQVEQGRPTYRIQTPGGGALQAISLEGLVKWARARDCVLVLRYGIGEFVPAGAVIFVQKGGEAPTKPSTRRLLALVALGVERTIEQDPGFAVRVLVDIAIKALSPAVNDPTTAVQAIDHLEDTLLLIGRSNLQRRRQYRDHDGRLRLIVPAASWSDFLSQAVTEIREYGGTSVQVMRRLRAMLELLRTEVLPDHRPAVEEEMHRLALTLEEGFGGHVDLDRASRADRQGIGGPSVRGGTAPPRGNERHGATTLAE